MSRKFNDTHRPSARTPALDAALLLARLAAPALQRDRRAPPTHARAGFSYPSQESIQEAERGLLDHGLMLVDVAQVAVSRDEVKFVWRLTHVASGEEQRFELNWPTFDDIGEHAHARAACWSHAREKVVCHLLQLRVLEVSAPPAEKPDFVPSWQGSGRGDERPQVKLTSKAAPPYTAELLAKLVEEWQHATGARTKANGAEGDGAAQTWPRGGLADAWNTYMRDRHPLAEQVAPTTADYPKLYYWLHDRLAGIL